MNKRMRTKRIIGITGYSKSGKSSIARALHVSLSAHGMRPMTIALAEPIYRMAQYAFHFDSCHREQFKGWRIQGWEQCKNGRDWLEFVGTQITRSVDPDFYVRILKQQIDYYCHYVDTFIVPDVRFKNEAEFIKGVHEGITTDCKIDDYLLIKVMSDEYDESSNTNQYVDKIPNELVDYRVTVDSFNADQLIRKLQT